MAMSLPPISAEQGMPRSAQRACTSRPAPVEPVKTQASDAGLDQGLAHAAGAVHDGDEPVGQLLGERVGEPLAGARGLPLGLSNTPLPVRSAG
jgi:hypothetical protein